MPRTMVADRPISVLHHSDKVYKPHPKTGEFEIDDNHVDGVRPHGLMLKDEAEAKKKAKAAASAPDKAKDDEIAQLRARVAELEKAGKPA